MLELFKYLDEESGKMLSFVISITLMMCFILIAVSASSRISQCLIPETAMQQQEIFND